MDDSIMRRMAAGLLAVREQTDFLHQQFGRAETQWKQDGTRVTAADLEISRAIFENLSRRFPEDQLFSEESDGGEKPVSIRPGFAWILDPIDGTNNFALGIPVCAISLALLQDGIPVCGFVYDHGLRTLFHGGPGIGVFADGVRIQRTPGELNRTKIVAMHSPVDRDYLPLVNAVLADYKLRAFGSGALHLAYVAIGRIDAALDFTVRVWDIAAAWAFCQELGVAMHFFDGPVFPLHQFDVKMEPIRYLAAEKSALESIVPRLQRAGIPSLGGIDSSAV